MATSDEAGANAVALMRSLRQRRVTLSLKEGELHFAAPKGTLCREDMRRIAALREEIVAYLQRVSRETVEHRRRRSAPLTFSQLKHWRFHSVNARLPLCDVASAIRLRGHLDVEAMADSLAKVVERHEALRGRIVLVNDSPEQEIAESGDWSLQVLDLTSLSPSVCDVEARRQIDQLILRPVRFETGPLFRVRLITLQEDEHLLAITTEHIISDAVSVNLLLRDLLAFYLHAVAERPLCLPLIGVQFPDYAKWQQDTHAAWLEQHGEYWQRRSMRGLKLRFPEDGVLPAGGLRGRGVVSLEIGHELKTNLRDCCRRARTTLVLGMFAAYAACALRWCQVAEAGIGYQIDGRMTSDVRNTVGFFASTLYLCASLHQSTTFNDLLRQITDEYWKAYEHADSWYMATLVPPPEFIGNTIFNWVPQPETSVSEQSAVQSSITVVPFPFENPSFKRAEHDTEPLILLADTERGLIIDIHFPLRRFRDETMQRFGRNFVHFMTALAMEPGTRVMNLTME